jgi:hypothetical protein
MLLFEMSRCGSTSHRCLLFRVITLREQHGKSIKKDEKVFKKKMILYTLCIVFSQSRIFFVVKHWAAGKCE